MRSVSAPAAASTSSICRDGIASEEVEPRGHALALEQRRRGEQIAQRRAAVAAEEHLRHRLPGEVAHGAHLPLLVEQQRVDRAEIDVDDLLAGRARVGRERAVRLRAALIAQEHLGALVAHEERRRGADLRRERRQHAALAHRQQARARPRELEHHRRAARLLDPAHDVAEAAPQELERDVARADERPQPPAEEDLHADRRAHEHRALGERLRERRGRHDEREHPDAADAREARIVGDAEPRRAREALEVHRRRETRRRRARRGCRARASRPTPRVSIRWRLRFR